MTSRSNAFNHQRNDKPACDQRDIRQGDPLTLSAARGSTEMTLRDWFAGHALAGLMSDPDGNLPPEPTARIAYSFADAMLIYRAKGGAE